MPRWTKEELDAWATKKMSQEKPLRITHLGPIPLEIKASTDVQRLNKTERAYLEFLKANGEDWIGIQCVTLKLADDCRLTPDFATIDKDGLTLIDVKGFQREDALIKMKVAARMFPWARFVIVKRDGANWSHAEVKP